VPPSIEQDYSPLTYDAVVNRKEQFTMLTALTSPYASYGKYGSAVDTEAEMQ